MAGLGLAYLLCWAVLSVGQSTPKAVADLAIGGLEGSPYFQPLHFALLYCWSPLVAISACSAFLLPGIFLVLAGRVTTRWTLLLAKSFAASLILYWAVGAIVKLLSAGPASARSFLWAMAATGLLTWCLLATRVLRGGNLQWPFSDRRDIRRLWWTLGIPPLFLIALLPVLFWQDLHDDGVEALELGRSLFIHLSPRFPVPGGLLGIEAGMIPMAFPVHWFLSLFGPLEVSARLPLLIYLPILFCLVIELSEHLSSKALGPLEEGCLTLALGIYAVTMGFNASYDPYFADLAAPTAFESLTVLSILAAITFLWRQENSWFLFFAALSFLCRPTGLLTLLFLGLATAPMLHKGMKPYLHRIAIAAVLCLAAAMIYDKVYVPLNVGDATVGYSSGSVFKRLRFLTFDDLSRLSFVIFPSGILPFLSLFAYHKHDPHARVLTIFTSLYFVFFYVQSFVALHHFAPVMIIPLVVFWRLYSRISIPQARVVLVCFAVTSVLSLWLSLPRTFLLNRTVRSVGQQTAFLVGDYESDFDEQIRHAELLFELLPPDWEVEDPGSELVSGYLSLTYYSSRPKHGSAEINYVVQPLTSPLPEGFTMLAADESAALLVKDLQSWESTRFQTLPTKYRSPLYDLPRTTLFRHWGEPARNYNLDLKRLLPARLRDSV